MEAKERESEAREAAGRELPPAESEDAQRELTDDENGKLVVDEPLNQDPIVEAPVSQKSAPMEEMQSASEKATLDEDGSGELVEDEEFGKDVSDVTVQGVPVFVCKNLYVVRQAGSQAGRHTVITPHVTSLL